MVRELRGGESVCESLPKQRKSAERVEILDAAFGKSLPKFPIFLIWVENPGATVRKSLPKQRKRGEKGRESRCCFWEISTQISNISHMGRESQCHCAEISTQTAEIGRKG